MGVFFFCDFIKHFKNTFHELKVLKKVIITETFNIDFHNKLINIGLFCFFVCLFFGVFFSTFSTFFYFILSDLFSYFTSTL